MEEMGFIPKHTISNYKTAKLHYQQIFKDFDKNNFRSKVFRNKNHCLMGNHDNFSKYMDFINFTDFIQDIHYYIY